MRAAICEDATFFDWLLSLKKPQLSDSADIPTKFGERLAEIGSSDGSNRALHSGANIMVHAKEVRGVVFVFEPY